ncbi:MAG: hypothetical protein ACR2HE_09890 [Casimicrobiaceae bacterium]
MMNERTFSKTALAAAMFLALSSTAFAQTTGQTGTAGGVQPPGTTAQQPGTATTPSGTPQSAAPGQTTGMAKMPTKSDNTQSAFKMLDPANRGYVTREEMDRLSGFSGFDAADANRDGRLTNEEFSKAWSTYGTK